MMQFFRSLLLILINFYREDCVPSSSGTPVMEHLFPCTGQGNIQFPVNQNTLFFRQIG